jgi:hypothetical protein
VRTHGPRPLLLTEHAIRSANLHQPPCRRFAGPAGTREGQPVTKLDRLADSATPQSSPCEGDRHSGSPLWARAPVLLLPVWRIALPSVSEKVDVSVVGHRDGHASLLDRPIPAVAPPSQVHIRNPPDGRSRAPRWPRRPRRPPDTRDRTASQIRTQNPSNSRSLAPARPRKPRRPPDTRGRRIRQIAVLGHLHGHTSLIDRSIPIIALPTASVAVRVCILRYLGGTSLG